MPRHSGLIPILMRHEWRWGLAAVAALTVGAIGAETYARLAAPYYTLAARWIASGRLWEIVAIDVAPSDSGPGTLLQLTGGVRERTADREPAATVVSKLQLGAVVESPLLFSTLLLLWPAESIRRRLAFFALGIPVFLGLEVATTVCQLVSPLAYASAVLTGDPDPVTSWDRWSRFLEGGGRVALAFAAAIATVSLTQIVGRRRLGP